MALEAIKVKQRGRAAWHICRLCLHVLIAFLVVAVVVRRDIWGCWRAECSEKGILESEVGQEYAGTWTWNAHGISQRFARQRLSQHANAVDDSPCRSFGVMDFLF
ncbi:hypothetical protein ACJQWK_03403 [Exserohilum turcicum]